MSKDTVLVQAVPIEQLHLQEGIIAFFRLWLSCFLKRKKKWLKNEALYYCSCDIQVSWKDIFRAYGQGSVLPTWLQSEHNPP